MIGVNVIGPVFGEFGIGEDIRALVKALLSLDISVNIFEYPKRGNFHNSSYAFESLCSDKLVHKVSIFCLPLFEIFRLFSEFGPEPFEGKYNIGYSPWELENWPKQFSFMANYLDEIWASSHHTLKAYQKNLSLPVYPVPLIVELSEFDSSKQSNQNENLDESLFKFLYVFDSNSTFARKNPHDAIKAFNLAFEGDMKVRLILKTMNYQFEDKALNKYMQNPSNIHLINDCFSRSELFDLYRACDAYISLHKAEGFGQTIAEAMLLKKPVIVSNYSGNVDFCSNETAFLVEGKLEQLDAYDYPFWFSNRWFSPNIESAAEQMLKCFSFPELRTNITENAYQCISKSFSSQTISKIILDRLEKLTI